ncbi:MAG: hypothetical protein P8X42_11415 [Calditrichaceae bacterium]|jgi:hypothetical protein
MKMKIFLISSSSIILIAAIFLILKNRAIMGFTDFILGMAAGIFAVTVMVWLIAFIVSLFRIYGGSKTKKPFFQKEQLLLSGGMISMFTGILLLAHNRSDSIVLFISLVIIVFSIVTNIIYIRKVRNQIANA